MPPAGQGDPDNTFSPRWYARSLSCPHAGGIPVTMPAQQGHALPHRLEDPQVHCMETERHSLQDKGISESTIKTILAATRDTNRTVYKGRWESFVSWCRERGENPIHMSLKHVLDFLQTKSERLAVNTIKGYGIVTAISRRHAMVHGNPISLDL